MPPLRERGNDIMMLADHFLKIANHELDRNVTTFAPEVVECFMNYRWQGNIRELKERGTPRYFIKRGERDLR
jgi:two-component system response regulator HydG